VCTHIGSREKSFSFLEPEVGVLGGGACTVIGRTHSVFSLPSIRSGCSYLWFRIHLSLNEKFL